MSEKVLLDILQDKDTETVFENWAFIAAFWLPSWHNVPDTNLNTLYDSFENAAQTQHVLDK